MTTIKDLKGLSPFDPRWHVVAHRRDAMALCDKVSQHRTDPAAVAAYLVLLPENGQMNAYSGEVGSW